MAFYPIGNGAPAAAAAPQQLVNDSIAEENIGEEQNIADQAESDYSHKSGGSSPAESDAGSGAEDDGHDDAAGQQPISSHMSSRRKHRERERARKALHKPHKEDNVSSIRILVEATLSPADLAAGRGTIKLNPRAAQKFLRAVVDPKTGNEVLIGDLTRVQFKSVKLHGYRNELPVNIGLDSDVFVGGITPKVLANSGLEYPIILQKESADKLNRASSGHCLYENLVVINEDLFNEWGSVTIEELTRGITPITGTDESFLDITENKRLVDIIHQNVDQLQSDFPKFQYKELVRDVKRSRTKVRVFNEVLQKAIELGVKLGVKPMQDSTRDARSFGLSLKSTTSDDGTFSDLQERLTALHGADQALDIMQRHGQIVLDLEISAKVPGTKLDKVGGSVPAAAASRYDE